MVYIICNPKDENMVYYVGKNWEKNKNFFSKNKVDFKTRRIAKMQLTKLLKTSVRYDLRYDLDEFSIVEEEYMLEIQNGTDYDNTYFPTEPTEEEISNFVKNRIGIIRLFKVWNYDEESFDNELIWEK